MQIGSVTTEESDKRAGASVDLSLTPGIRGPFGRLGQVFFCLQMCDPVVRMRDCFGCCVCGRGLLPWLAGAISGMVGVLLVPLRLPDKVR